MAESASSSATSGLQFGNNGGADGNGPSPLVMAAAIAGSLVFLGFIVWVLTHHRKG